MTVEEKIRLLAADYAQRLAVVMAARVEEMAADDRSHLLIYRVLGITAEEGYSIDVYQNKGRYLYKYAGTFLETAAKLCFKERYPEAKSIRIPNTRSPRPKTFEVDCLVENEAVEIKWRDATTDGDHINKEHDRVKVIAESGYTPVRVMFYYPNRLQAIRIQQTIETLYAGVNGRYYAGEAAWDYVLKRTDIDLKGILERLAEEKSGE
jgi:hypothetical protein